MADYADEGLTRLAVLGTVCLIFGITVILFPSLVVWIVGLFLVIQGSLLLTDYLEQQRPRPAATKPRVVYCPSCGQENVEEAVYCKRCGKQLRRGEQIATPQPQEIIQ